jgi:HNH endonuclease
MIDAAYVRACFNYDEETGALHWNYRDDKSAQWNSRLAGKKAGCVNQGYLRVQLDGKSYFAHRLIWLMVSGEWPDPDTDHVNGNKLDNRFSNLRVATHAQNMQNMRKHQDGQAQFKGVSPSGDRFEAYIYVKGKKKHLGRFESDIVAAVAYDDAAKAYYREFANTNFP